MHCNDRGVTVKSKAQPHAQLARIESSEPTRCSGVRPAGAGRFEPGSARRRGAN